MRVLNTLWRIPIKIMKSGVFLMNMQSTAASRRRRPMHTCWASCLAMANRACMKAQDFDGPLGSMVQRATTFTNYFFPIVYPVLNQWLALLAFVDDRILTVETMIEIVYPPSIRLFDKIDGVVCSLEFLPQHIDDALRKFPSIVHHYFPSFDWIIFRLISWLNRLLFVLSHWGSRNTREKEITIDFVNWNDIKSEAEEKASVKSLAMIDQYSDSSDTKVDSAKSYALSQPSYAEVIQLPLKRLSSVRKMAFDEPQTAVDSPLYSSYLSANSSPVSDCSQDDQTNSFSQIGKTDALNCSYKEMLEKRTRDDGETKDGLEFCNAFTNGEKAEIAEANGKYREEGTIKRQKN